MTNTSRVGRSWIPSLVASVLLLPSTLARAQTQPPPEPAPGPPPVVVEPAPVVVTEPPPPPPPPPPEPVTSGNKGKLTIKGFLSATMFAQDAPFFFGDGQNAEFPLPTRDKGNDPWFIDGDIRNTRLNLTWEGPTGDKIPKLGAQVEVDFFAGTFGGAFGNAQAVPRIRLAFADIALGPGTFRIGQNWAPWFGNVAVSLSHFAFPLGYGSGGAGGWRFVGLWYIVPLTPKDAALGATVTLALMRNVWSNWATPNTRISTRSPGPRR